MVLCRKTKHFMVPKVEDSESFRSKLFEFKDKDKYVEPSSILSHFGDSECLYFGKSISFFSPRILNSVILDGIFPMSSEFHGIPFAVFKLHKIRTCVFLCIPENDVTLRKLCPFCNLKYREIRVKRNLLQPVNSKLKTPSFRVFLNRTEDIFDVFLMLYQQHSDNWLCLPLRQSFIHMILNPDEYETKIIITAVRRESYGTPDAVKENEVREGELVACELGYVVGDIYTSATGAYAINSGGCLQLRIMGDILKDVGCRVWDLGMYLDYKKELLDARELKREDWLSIVKSRREEFSSDDVLGRIKAKYRDGVSVQSIIEREKGD